MTHSNWTKRVILITPNIHIVFFIIDIANVCSRNYIRQYVYFQKDNKYVIVMLFVSNLTVYYDISHLWHCHSFLVFLFDLDSYIHFFMFYGKKTFEWFWFCFIILTLSTVLVENLSFWNNTQFVSSNRKELTP